MPRVGPRWIGRATASWAAIATSHRGRFWRAPRTLCKPIRVLRNVYRHRSPVKQLPARGTAMRPLRILTWHVHGNYLYYLSQARAEFFLPVKPHRRNPYGGLGATFPFGPNVHEVPAEAVRNLDLDCVLFQSHQNYLEDQYEILSEAQQRLPRIMLE